MINNEDAIAMPLRQNQSGKNVCKCLPEIVERIDQRQVYRAVEPGGIEGTKDVVVINSEGGEFLHKAGTVYFFNICLL